jgi:hypothetical protein
MYCFCMCHSFCVRICVYKQAETVHVHKRPFTHIEHLFGLFFAQSRARIGAAVARGMALRAMGCSLMGVSNVLAARCSHSLWGSDLRGWRALSSGVLTVAPCACCVNLYVCMYNVRILRVFPYFYHCLILLVFSCLFWISNKSLVVYEYAVIYIMCTHLGVRALPMHVPKLFAEPRTRRMRRTRNCSQCSHITHFFKR